MRPRERLAQRVHPRGQTVVVVRPIHVVLDIFLARPDHLDGTTNVPSDLNGAHGAVEFESPPKATPQQMIMEANPLAREARELHDRRLRETRYLRAYPDVARIRRHLHGAVHRLHRGMRQEGLFVDRLDRSRSAGNDGGSIAFMTCDD